MTGVLTALVPVLWALTFLAPLAAAGALAAARCGPPRRARRTVALAPLAVAPALALTLVPSLDGAVPEGIEVPWLLLGAVLHLDPLARSLTLVAVLLYGAAIHAVRHRTDGRPAELAAFLLVCFTGNVLLYVAGDVATFYSGYAMMSFGSFALVLHERTRAARRAGRVYVPLTVLSEFAVLAGLILVADAGGMRVVDAPAAVAASPHAGVIVALLVFGFGIKAGLVPFHVWMPVSYAAAPSLASAVLSGAMAKAGLVGWLRFLPLAELGMPRLGLILVALALLGAFGAAILGVLQRDPDVVIAYSSVSQMGYLAAVVGTALAVPDLAPAAVSAATIYAVHHGLAKGALFLAVPVWRRHAHGARRWLSLAGFALAGAAVAGAPFTGGSIGKYATKYAVDGVTVLGLDLHALLPFVATGTTLLVLRAGVLLWHTEVAPEADPAAPEFTAWWALVLASATVPLLVTRSWLPVTDVPDVEATTLWDAAWPVLLGLALGGLGRWWHRRRGRSVLLTADGELRVPPGDLVVVHEAGAAAAVAGGRRAYALLGRGRDRAVEVGRAVGAGVLTAGRRTEAAEGVLTGWRGSGTALLLVLLALAALGVIA